MTSNQIAYWKLQEERRSNLVDEAERQRANIAQENIKRDDTNSQIKRREIQNIKDSVGTATDVASTVAKLFN